MADPTYYLFGGAPTTVIMQTSDNFNGAAYASSVVPTITPGLSTFPAQSGGGLMNFHKKPVKITNIYFADGGGTLAITLEYPTVSVPIATLNNSNPSYTTPIVIPVGSSLKFVSSGASSAKSITIMGIDAGPADCFC